MSQVLLFAIGFALGWIWFGHVGFALFYGTPRGVMEVIRGTVRPSAAFAYVFMIVLWTIIFVAVAFGLFALGLATKIMESQSAVLGELLGLGYGATAALSRSGRTALNDDFWTTMAPYRHRYWTRPEGQHSAALDGSTDDVLHGKKSGARGTPHPASASPKCPKCGYLGFAPSDRCRNCGARSGA